ncbi:hypothetical protein [Paenibacillus alkalitolerans]|uniref:hypothetical protein n=1 Tax=Paenibacillus alkalitolerans TaxID=2799335 RepID=UPI0018F78EFF|nr:hypothetical protein [Paenibacillus alkalitolerans]
MKEKILLPFTAFILLTSIVGCSTGTTTNQDVSRENQVTAHDHNLNEQENVEEQKERTEKQIHDNSIDFKGVKLPKEAMELFDTAVNDAKADASNVEPLFKELLSWLEKNASASIGFYMNYIEINKMLGYPEDTHPYELLKILNNDLLKNPDEVTNKEFKNKLIMIANNGLMFRTAEGDFEPTINFGYLLDKYDDILSEEMKEYLQIRASNSNIYDEESIIASYSQLAKNVIDVERFLTKYNESDMRTVVKNIYANVLASYLLAGQTKAEMKTIYESFLEEYHGSETHAYMIIDDFYKLLRENNFKYNDEVYKYINITIDQVR